MEIVRGGRGKSEGGRTKVVGTKEEASERDEREGLRLCGREGLMREAEYGTQRGRIAGGMETLEAAVPGRGAARERRWRLALDDAHHVVVIDVRGHERHANERYRIQIHWMLHIATTITRDRTVR